MMKCFMKFLVCLGCFFMLQLVDGVARAGEPKTKKPSPDQVLQMLVEGNKRFRSGKPTYPHTGAVRCKQAGSEDQADHAIATVIACSDSQVPVELIFDTGVMDIFTIRVAGNVCDTDEIGSIEYGLAHVHTPVFVMLGHTQCGAVTAVTHALQGHGKPMERNIPQLVDNIIPAVKKAMAAHADLRGDAIIPHAIRENVWQGIEDLFMKSPITRDLVKAGSVKIVGAIYDVGSGKVNWLPAKKVQEILEKVEASPDKETEVFAAY
jgi:carbonic anhydrase